MTNEMQNSATIFFAQLALIADLSFRQLHLAFPQTGNNKVANGFPRYLNNRVYINDTQYFANVELPVWNFQVHDHYPLQAWLNKRQEQLLSFTDILHCYRIILAIQNTLQQLANKKVLATKQPKTKRSKKDKPTYKSSASPHNDIVPVGEDTLSSKPNHAEQTIPPSLDEPIEILLLSRRTENALKRSGINTLRQLLEKSADILLVSVRSFGERGLDEVEKKLAKIGLQLGEFIVERPIAFPNADESELISPVQQVHALFEAQRSQDLDAPLAKSGFFPKRTLNALIRSGIVTPRLLLMQTPELLLQFVNNLGPKGLTDIVDGLATRGWTLAENVDDSIVTLMRLLALAFYKDSQPLPLALLAEKVNQYIAHYSWDEKTIAEVAAIHPYLVEIENGRFQFHIRPLSKPIYLPHKSSATVPPEPQPKLKTVSQKILLTNLWSGWLDILSERQRNVLLLRYGVEGGEILTLLQVSEALEVKVTRERVRQIEVKALEKIGSLQQRPFWQPLRQLIIEGVNKGNGILTLVQWETLLDENTIWDVEEGRPLLLPLLGATLTGYTYHNTLQVVTEQHISSAHLQQLDKILRRILRPERDGLALESVEREATKHIVAELPPEVYQSGFIRSAIALFERLDIDERDHCFYLRKKKKSRYPLASSGWAGRPGTKLHTWELKLRKEFGKINWIGQLALKETDFYEMCQIIQEEAQEANYFSKKIEGQPRRVPPAVFITTMVLAARYSQQAADEYWVPYLRNVWDVTYTQAFMARCRKRFVDVASYLEDTFSFVFPRNSDGDLVTAVYRHALLPSYVQAEFAGWLSSKWHDILAIASTPELLANYLKQEKSIDHLFHRLQRFITGEKTALAAAALISNMAAAISLHVNDGEAIDSISELLNDTPIERELWQEISKVFTGTTAPLASSLRQTSPRLTWIWSLDDEELALRVQNINLPNTVSLEGEPDRLVWLETKTDNPLEAEIEAEVNLWHMQNGDMLIPDVIISEPEGAASSQLVLMTDMDEEVLRLDIPQQPTASVQFFRITQQGAYGVPVVPSQLREGTWFVCAKRPLTFIIDDGEELEPDSELAVPYPLDSQYMWAAEHDISLPLTIKDGAKTLLTLTQATDQLFVGHPTLTGTDPILGLSRQVQPTFSSTKVSLFLQYGGERLLKQASLWISGQDHWQRHWSLAELQQRGLVEQQGSSLQVNFSTLLPPKPNLYTLELRISLQPLLAAPLQFAVIPYVKVEAPPPTELFTLANPPKIILQDIEETAVVHRSGLAIDTLQNGSQQITFTDLRQEPHLTLRFGQVDIPLAWALPRFMVWLEPKLAKPFLTLEELRQASLYAIGTPSAIESFRLFIPEQGGRHIRLKRGRYRVQIGMSQIYDMVRLAQGHHLTLKVRAGSRIWTLAEVRQRPQLTTVRAEYDDKEKVIWLETGLEMPWTGNGRFLAESLTNPFLPPVELAQTTKLEDIHVLPTNLPNGRYRFHIELDGSLLRLDEIALSFTIGDDQELLAEMSALVQEIRAGQLISLHLAEDFVLWWAELAEQSAAELTPTTLYQLATLPATVLDNFLESHLENLWSPLVALKKVQLPEEWFEQYGYLPAWLFLTHPLTFKTAQFAYPLKVFPLQVLQGGLRGTGYGRWRLSTVEGSPKTAVYVQWQPINGTTVQVEAGVPDSVPDNDWTAIDLLDTYALHYCARCGRLTGGASFTLSAELQNEHLHGRHNAALHDITIPLQSGGHQLVAELLVERRGTLLSDVYEEFEVPVPLPERTMSEPTISDHDLVIATTPRRQLLALVREIQRFGNQPDGWPLWYSSQQLLAHWRQAKTISQTGQMAVALGIALRTAAYDRQKFRRLRRSASLSEQDVVALLAYLNEMAPAHFQWGLVWAELLYKNGR